MTQAKKVTKTQRQSSLSKTNFKPTSTVNRLKPVTSTKEKKMTEPLPSKTAFHPDKPAKAKKERKPRDPNAPRVNAKSKELLDKKIKILVDKNPRRANSETFKIFELYKEGDTVADFLKKGGRIIDVKADVERKHISLS